MFFVAQRMTSPTLIQYVGVSVSSAAAFASGRLAVWSELAKARLTALVVLTTLAGFHLGSGGPIDPWRMFNTLAAIALLASGSAALNQYLERDSDRLMPRTQGRPLPSARLEPRVALVAGTTASILGLTWLALTTNNAAAGLGAAAWGLYLFVYTPLKCRTIANTLVGAVPGALPPLVGWTAAQGSLSSAGWQLFVIQFLWQLPHFLAIAWRYREDYARAGFRMLPLLDPTGARTGRHALAYSVALAMASLVPAAFGFAGQVYLSVAASLGLGLVWLAARFARDRSPARTRQLFFATLVYLPALLGALVWDKRG
jgi:protoheme IX farnesyltransferase